LRVVSRDFLGMIEAYEPFKDSQTLVVSKENFALGELESDLLQERSLSDLRWLNIRNIRINVYDVEQQSLHIPNFILNNVKFVSLVSKELEDEDNEKPMPVRSIQRILSSTRQISHLQLDINSLITPVSLPSLTSLRATVSYSTQQDTLKNFLENTNKNCLEELHVTVRCRYGFGRNLFDAIRQRSWSLKKLHLEKLQSFHFADEEEYEVEVDWTFLLKMKHLRDFQLARPRYYGPQRDSFGNGTLLLEALPRNQLQYLGLRGIGAKHVGFWRTSRRGGEPELPMKLDLLRRFRNVKRLSLRYCPDAVDDDIMRFIVEEMKSLEELEVSHCSRLTNAGVAGTSEDYSIRNVKCEWKYK